MLFRLSRSVRGRYQQKQYFSAEFWSCRVWLLHRQQPVLCILQITVFTREWRSLCFKNSEREAGESAVNRPTSHFPLQSMTAKNRASILERLEWKPSLCHQNLQYAAHFRWHSLPFPRNAFCGALNLHLAESLWFLSCTDIPSSGAAGAVQPHRAAYWRGFVM